MILSTMTMFSLVFGSLGFVAIVLALTMMCSLQGSCISRIKLPGQTPISSLHDDSDWVHRLHESLSKRQLGDLWSSQNDEDDDIDYLWKLMDGVNAFTTLDYPQKASKTNTTTQTFGYADYLTKQPMRHNAHFPIGSNTKLYTSVAIYQLREQGLLDVDVDIATMLDTKDFQAMGFPFWYRKYCPRLSQFGNCQVVTLRHLLSMSSGIYPTLNCEADSHPKLCNPSTYIFNLSGSLAGMVGTFLRNPLIFVPGTMFQYSNPNFILAAYFVEKYSGMTFRDYLQQNIFDKIGLQDTYYDFFNGVFRMDPKRPRQFYKYYVPKYEGHSITASSDIEEYDLLSVGTDTVQLDLGAASGTGGIVSTVADQRTFWYSLFLSNTSALFQHANSLENFVSANDLPVQLLVKWGNQKFDLWLYYTQGIVLLCLTRDCHDGDRPNTPRWIIYEGGTLTVHTANILDVHHGAMIQTWSSTVLAFPPSKRAFQDIVDSQTGMYLKYLLDWSDPRLDSNTNTALIQLWKRFPPSMKYGQGMNKEQDEDITPLSTSIK